MRRIGFTLLLVLSACLWSPPSGSFHETVLAARAQGAAVVALRPTSREWDLAYFFGPYTADSQIEAAVGVHCSTCSLIDLDERDDLNAVVLVKGNQLVQIQELPRDEADIRPGLLRRPFAPGTQFALSEDRDGVIWVESVAVEDSRPLGDLP